MRIFWNVTRSYPVSFAAVALYIRSFSEVLIFVSDI